jgi:hypothetical protein
MLPLSRSPVSRVRGAACKGVDHAGESPVVAIARFGYVAVPDVEGGRPLTAQAQAKVLGAGEPVRLIRRASELRGRSESEHYSVETASHVKWVVGYRAAEPSSRNGEGQWMPMTVTGESSRRLLRRIGGGTEGLISGPKQGKSHAREARGTSWQARRRVSVRLTDRVVVAMMLRDNTTLAERRTRGAAMCLRTRRRTRNVRPGVGLTGYSCRVAKASTKRASNSMALAARKGAREEIVRSRCLEAVLGKTRRTEFQRGTRKRKLRPVLNGHEAGNGGYSQASTFGPPRRVSTQQIRMHGLNGGPVFSCYFLVA